MNKQTKHVDLITLPTRDLIWNTLGDDQNGLSCAQITPATAMVLQEKLRGSRQWVIEYSNLDGSPLQYPLLWRYQDWASASSTYQKKKEYSRRMMLEHNLTKANVETLAKAIMRKSPIPEQAAQAMAYMLVKNPQASGVITFFGVTKLKTKEEEL